MKRVFVSGAGGFLGAHLIHRLTPSWTVVGAGRSADPPAGLRSWVRIRDEGGGLADAVSADPPDLVIHAAFLNRPEPDEAEEHFLGRQLETNLKLFERCARLDVPLLLISSSAVYGAGDRTTAFDESTPLRPVSLYGFAKTQQEMLAQHAARARGLALCTARLFNLVGPGRGQGTVAHDWIAQVAAIAGGGEPELRVRNRATRRDLVDVRDAAQAVALLADRFTPDEVYAVASGQAVSLMELSRYIESLCPVPYRTVETDAAPAVSDACCQIGNPAKIHASHGWRAEIGWRQSVREIWQSYHRQ